MIKNIILLPKNCSFSRRMFLNAFCIYSVKCNSSSKTITLYGAVLLVNFPLFVNDMNEMLCNTSTRYVSKSILNHITLNVSVHMNGMIPPVWFVRHWRDGRRCRVSLLAGVELRLNMTPRLVREDYNAIWTIVLLRTDWLQPSCWLSSARRQHRPTSWCTDAAGRCCSLHSLSS